jgi:hypothetical protein
MISVTFDSNQLYKDLTNITQYSEGFLEGVQIGKTQFLNSLGAEVIESMKNFIDAQARVDPQILSHVYEWYQSGSPDARLFDLGYTMVGSGLSFNYTFSQSKSIQEGSNVPFYNKAEVMEKGIPVTIVPKKSNVLAFEVDGEDVFTSSAVVVKNPGGQFAKDGFKNVLEMFFNSYFTQAFLQSSGIIDYISNPKEFDTNLPVGKRGGKSAGRKVGTAWIAKAGTLGV